MKAIQNLVSLVMQMALILPLLAIFNTDLGKFHYNLMGVAYALLLWFLFRKSERK